jgi:hypothetical protein
MKTSLRKRCIIEISEDILKDLIEIQNKTRISFSELMRMAARNLIAGYKEKINAK